MKIAIINKHIKDTLGGSEIQSDIIAEGLSNRGHDIVYIAVNGKENVDSIYNYQIISVPPMYDIILKKLLDESPDIIYWRSCRHVFPKFMKAFRNSPITSTPIVFAVSNRYDLFPSYAFTIYKSKFRALKGYFSLRKQFKWMQRTQGVTVLNGDYLPSVPHKNKVVVENAMKLDIVPFMWPRPYCVWVSNIKEVKRPESYISLAEKLKDCGIDFLMVGRIDENYQWIRNLKIDNFYFLGEKGLMEVNGILRSSLFHVHTCYPEGFGNVFIQAWLNGKPTVSLGFDPGGYMEKFNIGFNAADNFSKFQQYVMKFIQNEEERTSYGARALNFAQKTFTPNVLASKIETFLGSILINKI